MGGGGGSSSNNNNNNKAPAAEEDGPAAQSQSRWARIKAAIRSKTKAGRLESQHAAIEAEKQRQRRMDPAPFVFRPYELADLVDPKSVALLQERGGVQGLLNALGTDERRGLALDFAGGVQLVEGEGEAKDVEAAAAPRNTEKAAKGVKEGFVHATREERERVYGVNRLPERKSKSLLLLMWLTLQDKILILLSIAAVVSLALGLYTDFGTHEERGTVPCADPPPGASECEAPPEPKVDWVEGVAIIVAIVIVTLVGSLNDYQKELQFKKLNAKKEQRDVKVVRRGAPALMSVHDVLVGDVLQLEPGEIIPCDGVFLRGHNVKCDESGATGESDMIRKVPFDDCLRDLDAHRASAGKLPNRDCFLISGARVLEGVGEYVVIAVGPNSFNGKLLMSLRSDTEVTPLQAKLNKLADLVAKLGGGAGLLLFAALLIRFFSASSAMQQGTLSTPEQKGRRFLELVVISVTVIVVAVPEGLPLAVTLALAFATKRMTKMNLLVRVLGACETMANASVVCTDKTGTLTQNEMSVVAGSIGAHLKFAFELHDHQDRVHTSAGPVPRQQQHPPEGRSSIEHREGRRDWAIDQQQLSSVVRGALRTLLNDAIAINSTAFEEANEEHDHLLDALRPRSGGSSTKNAKARAVDAPLSRNGNPAGPSSPSFVGSKTETALLKMAKELGWEDYRTARARHDVVQMIPFSSERKSMGVVVRLADGKGVRLFAKGASEVLSKLCSKHVEVPQPQPGEGEGGDGDSRDAELVVRDFDDATRENIAKTIIFYANQTLRTIAICYRDFEQWPPIGAPLTSAKVEVDYKWLAQDMTLIAITGIEDPLRPGVKDAVAACGRAGVQVKMCTGDNVLTARSIATQCGIFTPGGIIMEGPVFRNLGEQDMREVVPRLQVLARSSPEDKKILVERLKSMGHVVGVTGDGTNDGPALKTANVGFSMGIAGTEVAKEASDIILMDDNFASIVSAIMWGRTVNDAVRKFLQFQLSVNIVAVLVTFVTAIASDEEESALTAVQLLWINLIMDTLAALALATDPAHPSLLDRKPDKASAPLITVNMWKMIIGQSIYQLALILILNFAGARIFHHTPADQLAYETQKLELSALIFNAFVWCQLFSQVNSRRLDRRLNIFEGIHRNPWFIGIMLIEIGAQILIVFVGGAAFRVTRLSGRDWAISIIAGMLTIPIGVLVRLIPTEPIEQAAKRYRLIADPDALPSSAKGPAGSALEDDYVAQAKDYEEATGLGQVAERLSAFSRIRGGRVRATDFVLKTRAKRMREADVHPHSLMALVPALIGASIGSGWKPTNPREASMKDPAAGDPTLDSVELFRGERLVFHPDTKDDEFLERLKGGRH
ncbi:calcium-translocating P-type ATPase [Tilletiaria anomala UBC 951]|uniref:Calcium-transporting ATPase n=1 Tax=Tilletiaria anomala (strain ATCC 24038 / CBS 436.72 / UBC 951) TaxID=1037660 RepID=A0A066WLV7_TILAU|nr:calcium-translocating P-type ATPase [Tilletiaria anomala UBC 951]KDN51974.1 calcium-translocating P-type ATPase [Tilletiaria anomala UBC 951]